MEVVCSSIQTITLGSGAEIPQIGFGTFQIWPYEAQRAVEDALALGYRHVDTAAAYCNEAQVGAALKATGMTGEVFVTTKRAMPITAGMRSSARATSRSPFWASTR